MVERARISVIFAVLLIGVFMKPSRLRLLQHTECPPDEFRYRFTDGYTVKCFNYDGWLARIAAHRRNNGYVKLDDWIAEAEDQLCRILPAGWCEQETGAPPEFYLDARMTLDDVLNGTKVLASFVGQGMPLVSRDVAEARGKTCAGCYAAVSIPGCSPCVGLASLVADIAGAEPLTSDPFLENKSCAVCKCSARAQIWLPIELLAKGVPDEMLPKFPEWCWKKKGVEQLRAT